MILPKPGNGAERNLDLLAYNLLRSLMWQSAQQSQVLPLRMSLQGARQQFNQFRPELAQTTAQNRRCLYSTLLHVISDQLVPLRPHRAEPRVTKKDPEFSQNAATSLRPQS